MTFLDLAGTVFVILGALLFASAALGIIRFFDPYTRISAVGTAGGLGIVLVVVGALLMQPTVTDTVKVLLIIGLQLATSAIGSIAIARSAYLTGAKVQRSLYNDLEPRR